MLGRFRKPRVYPNIIPIFLIPKASRYLSLIQSVTIC